MHILYQPHNPVAVRCSYISQSLIKMTLKERKRFVDLNETNINQLLEDKDSASTKRIVLNSVTLFNSFLKSKNFDPSIVYDKVRLNYVLRFFYPSIRTTKSEYFKRNNLNGIRYGLAKHFKTKGIDITNDSAFTSSREFFSIRFGMKKKCFGSTDHTSPILYRGSANYLFRQSCRIQY